VKLDGVFDLDTILWWTGIVERSYGEVQRRFEVSQIAKFNCDMCGTEKKESNHWFLGQVFTFEQDKSAVSICQWSDGLAMSPDSVHLCGEKCFILFSVKHLKAK